MINSNFCAQWAHRVVLVLTIPLLLPLSKVNAQHALLAAISEYSIQSSSTVASSQAPIQSYLDDCKVIFTPYSVWLSEYPNCEVIPAITNCSSLPTVDVRGEDCYPEVGEYLLGYIFKYNGTTLVAKYKVLAEDGGIEIILMDEY